MKKYQHTFLTEKGRRETNQDNVAVLVDNKHKAYLLVVADGMGGYKGGETASKIVVDAAAAIFEKAQKSLKNKKKLKHVIQLILDTAQQNIKEYITQNPELSGMGTTLVCLLVVDNMAVWGNIGDSRAYLQIGDTDPKQITHDHSLVQDYMDKHSGSVPGNYLNKYSNVITRSIAGSSDKIDIFPANEDFLRIEDDFTFLLCSDGLILDKSYDYSYFFFDIINKAGSFDEAVTNLYNWAFDSGSTDNISIAILSNKKTSKRKTKVKKTYAILTISLILLILGGAVYYYSIKKDFFKIEHVTNKSEDKKIEGQTNTIPTGSQWQGFTNTKSLTYNLKGNTDWSWSINWHEYNNSNNSTTYILKIVNKKNPHKIVSEQDNIINEHITIKDLENQLKKLNPGAYEIELFAKTNSGDTSKSPNSITLTVK